MVNDVTSELIFVSGPVPNVSDFTNQVLTGGLELYVAISRTFPISRLPCATSTMTADSSCWRAQLHD